MGLDMYAFATRNHPNREVDFTTGEENEELFYWRKHPNLHGWMERLYKAKGGVDADFNCSALLVTPKDLDDLEAAVKGEALPETSGFFFGVSGPRMEEDLTFIRKAREAIAEGKSVIYYAWW